MDVIIFRLLCKGIQKTTYLAIILKSPCKLLDQEKLCQIGMYCLGGEWIAAPWITYLLLRKMNGWYLFLWIIENNFYLATWTYVRFYIGTCHSWFIAFKSIDWNIRCLLRLKCIPAKRFNCHLCTIQENSFHVKFPCFSRPHKHLSSLPFHQKLSALIRSFHNSL